MASRMVSRTAPGVRQLLPLPYGSLGRLRRDPIGFLLDGRRRYGDVFRHQFGPLTFHLVSHPDHVRRVLLDNQKNYPRSRFYDRVRIVGGDGLVTTEGPPWRRLRRMVQPAFHHQRIAALADVMTEAAGVMLGRWREPARCGEPLDVAAEYAGLTLRIVGRTLLSIEFGGETDRIGEAVTRSLEFLDRRLNSLWILPASAPTPTNLRGRRAIKTLDEVVFGVIAERRRHPGRGEVDLLAMLLASRDEETGEDLSDRELRDQIITFIGAGHETTAVALAWTTYLLARNPDAERRLRAEVGAVLDGRTPTAADPPRLAFTRRVIEESLRLYPPVFAVARDVVADDEIGGHRIPARSMIALSPYVTHRHPEFWPDPEAFDPDRFGPEASAGRSRFAWCPFLGGPHQCIGQEFAMMEMILVVAMVIQAFRFDLVPGAEVRPKPLVSLRPGGGVPVILHPCR